MIKTALDREHVIFRTEEPQTLEVVQIIYRICGCQIVLKFRRSKQLSIMVYLLDFLLRFENSGKRFYYNSDRKFWIVSTIGDFAKLQSWMTVQQVLSALLKLSWKAFYNENYPPKKQRLHLINIIEDSFGFLCWLGLVNQRISSFIASAIKL